MLFVLIAGAVSAPTTQTTIETAASARQLEPKRATNAELARRFRETLDAADAAFRSFAFNRALGHTQRALGLCDHAAPTATVVDARVEALELRARIQAARNDGAATERELAALLTLRPDHSLDAAVFPPPVLEALERARRAQRKTTPAVIEVTPTLTGTLLVDGRPAGTPGRLTLPSGRHYLLFEVEGFSAVWRTFDAEPGASLSWTPVLSPQLTSEGDPASPAPPSPAPATDIVAWYEQPWNWGIIGTALVAVGVGAWLLLRDDGRRTVTCCDVKH